MEIVIRPDMVTETQAKKIHHILQKIKGRWKNTVERLVDFKEPIAILARSNGKAEWLEGVTPGRLEYEHSDGTKRFINIEKTGQISLPYADREIKVYLLHENYPLPLTLYDKPIVDTRDLSEIISKTIFEFGELAKNTLNATKEKMKMVMYVVGFIALLFVGAWILPAVGGLIGLEIPCIIGCGEQATEVVTKTVAQNVTTVVGTGIVVG